MGWAWPGKEFSTGFARARNLATPGIAMWVDVTDKDTGEGRVDVAGESGLTARLAPYATASDRPPRMVFKPKGLCVKV